MGGRSPDWAARAELAVERLYFRCPTTGEEIDLGIESELGTLLRIRRSAVRARCPRCAQWHAWRVGDARLAKAA
jgi:hypothetical protein